ncbi:MAG: NUDIX hydrolase [Nanoarchaeota archaeon]
MNIDELVNQSRKDLFIPTVVPIIRRLGVLQDWDYLLVKLGGHWELPQTVVRDGETFAEAFYRCLTQKLGIPRNHITDNLDVGFYQSSAGSNGESKLYIYAGSFYRSNGKISLPRPTDIRAVGFFGYDEAFLKLANYHIKMNNLTDEEVYYPFTMHPKAEASIIAMNLLRRKIHKI